jgi:UDP-N-acetyl-D-glucosamine/UDP-N-acetyl-D-galactosamine dehydrogenase
MILAGRRINDGMGAYVAGQLVKAMLKKRIQVEGSRVLVMGLTFKENCPDLRNTRVVDIIHELGEYDVDVDVCDPWANAEEAASPRLLAALALRASLRLFDALRA